MTAAELEAKYQAEVTKADHDHHKPTAGAMSGHIVANMWYLDVKFHQALWFVHGEQAFSLQQFYKDLIAQNRRQLDELGELLLDENELPPSTVKEYDQYAQITEEPRLKYEDASVIVDATAHDLTVANMFVDRAIKLAQREERPAMALWLTQLRGSYNKAIRQAQAFLGKTAWEGLVEDDDDDED